METKAVNTGARVVGGTTLGTKVASLVFLGVGFGTSLYYGEQVIERQQSLLQY